MIFSILFGINWFSLCILFILAFLASFGLPGAVFFLVFLGALASNLGEILLISSISLLGVFLGDVLAYESARKLQSSFHSKLRKFDFFRKREKETEKILKNRMFYMIFFTRFVMRTMCSVVNYVSGFKKINRKIFISAIILGEIIYVSLYPLIGFFFKKTWEGIINLIGQISLLILIGILLFLLIRRMVKNKKVSR